MPLESPVLYVMAGPNGIGKTAYYLAAQAAGLIDPALAYANVDMLCRRLGSYSQENIHKAEEEYRRRVAGFLVAGIDFMIESNLADSRSYDWLELVKRQGYRIVLFYLSTDDLQLLYHRIEVRVSQGGHDVPKELVQSRYRQSLSYLKTKIGYFNEVHLLENGGGNPIEQANIINGVLSVVQPVSAWVTGSLEIFQRLMERKANQKSG